MAQDLCAKVFLLILDCQIDGNVCGELISKMHEKIIEIIIK